MAAEGVIPANNETKSLGPSSRSFQLAITARGLLGYIGITQAPTEDGLARDKWNKENALEESRWSAMVHQPFRIALL
ncbi:hypothetical protein CsSME_00002463 [Camellia sinensis var. sinensis]